MASKHCEHEWGCESCFGDEEDVKKDVKKQVEKVQKNSNNADVLNQILYELKVLNRNIQNITLHELKSLNQSKTSETQNVPLKESYAMTVKKEPSPLKIVSKEKVLKCLGPNCDESLNGETGRKLCIECLTGTKIKCVLCQHIMYFSDEQKTIYERRGWDDPKICKVCKDKFRKNNA